jgi:hypothetical protein
LTCEIPDVSEENLKIIELYNLVSQRFIKDFQAIGFVFEIYRQEMTRAEAQELLFRLCMLHELICKYNEKLK